MEYKKIVIRKKIEEKEDMIEVDESRLLSKTEFSDLVNKGSSDIKLVKRICSEFQGRAYFVPKGTFDWAFGVDKDNMLCLIPLKKTEG